MMNQFTSAAYDAQLVAAARLTGPNLVMACAIALLGYVPIGERTAATALLCAPDTALPPGVWLAGASVADRPIIAVYGTPLPSLDTSIDAAMDLVFVLQCDIDYGESVTVGITQYLDGWEVDLGIASGAAPTLPVAIARAAVVTAWCIAADRAMVRPALQVVGLHAA